MQLARQINPNWNPDQENGKEPDLNVEASSSSSLFTVFNVLFALFCVWYAWMFWKSVEGLWFHPHWTTDDALQQIYPFHAVYHPEIFKDDLITEVMVGYLAPIHYWLCYGITWLVGDPIMMGHWVMLLQAVLACGFLFFAIKHLAGVAPAFFGVVWLLHTRHVMQRLTAGLPRGWAAVVLAVYLNFIVRKNHKGVLLTLLAGCLLHPPATLICAASYGLFLLWGVARNSTRAEYLRPLLTLLLLSPFYILITYSVIKRPAHIGSMVTFEQASQMPEFSREKGRFPFVPLRSAEHEIKSFGFQAFIGRFYNPGRFWKRNTPWMVTALLVLLVVGGLARKRNVLPAQLFTFFLAIMVVYFASRLFAFKLYVPNRHLQFPMAFFFIPAFTVAVWRLFHRDTAGGVRSTSLRSSWLAVLMIVALGGFIYRGSHIGLNGKANFNYAFDKKGHIFQWIRDNTDERAIIAGHPQFIDAVQLFGMRRGYVTTETSHPFYPEYYKEVHRRLQVALKAHWAKDFEELVNLVEPEGIDYFVFERARFYKDEESDRLKQDTYYRPLDKMVEELTSRHWQDYVYRKLPDEIDLEKAPFMPFKDARSAVVDIAKLKEYLATQN